MNKQFWSESMAASSAEYALILAVVGVGLGAATLSLGANIRASINSAATDVYVGANASAQGDANGYTAGTGNTAQTASNASASTGTGTSSGTTTPGSGQPTNPGCAKGNGKKGC